MRYYIASGNFGAIDIWLEGVNGNDTQVMTFSVDESVPTVAQAFVDHLNSLFSPDNKKAVNVKHDYVSKSNAAGYLWQCSKCHQTRPYLSQPDFSNCLGAPCLCAYDPRLCELHGRNIK